MICNEIIKTNNKILKLEGELRILKSEYSVRLNLLPVYFTLPFIFLSFLFFVLNVSNPPLEMDYFDIFLLYFICVSVYLKSLIHIKIVSKKVFSFKSVIPVFIFSLVFFIICYVVPQPDIVFLFLFCFSLSFVFLLTEDRIKIRQIIVFSKSNITKILSFFNTEIKNKELEIEENIKEIKRLMPNNENEIEEMLSDDSLLENFDSIFSIYLKYSFDDLNNLDKKTFIKKQFKTVMKKNKTNRKTITV